MITLELDEGFAVLRGRKENEWVIAPWWPCSGAVIRKVAPDKLPRAFVAEAAAFADETFKGSEKPE
jgi:hypothetical protein